MGLPLPVVCFEHGIGGVICMGGGSRERRSGTENRVSGSIRGENIVREGVPNGVRGRRGTEGRRRHDGT